MHYPLFSFSPSLKYHERTEFRIYLKFNTYTSCGICFPSSWLCHRELHGYTAYTRAEENKCLKIIFLYTRQHLNVTVIWCNHVGFFLHLGGRECTCHKVPQNRTASYPVGSQVERALDHVWGLSVILQCKPQYSFTAQATEFSNSSQFLQRRNKQINADSLSIPLYFYIATWKASSVVAKV